MPKTPIHLALVVSRLNKGGTEVQILELARALQSRDYKITLLTFYPENQLWNEALSIAGIKCVSLNKQSRWDLFFPLRMIFELKKHRPDIIYSFLTAANLICLFIRPFFPFTKMVWGFRTSKTDFSHFDTFSGVIAKWEGRLSRFTTVIVANSLAGKSYAKSIGFPEAKIRVIPNGIDTERFVPDENERMVMRQKLGVASSEQLIGIVGRFDPLKDHCTFLKAARIVAKKRKNVKFLIVGVRETDGNLKAKFDNLDLKDRLIFTGLRENTVPYYQAMDLFCSSSTTEGFSNAIAEAMATGVPCVVTDVGDSQKIVGETGWVVQAKKPESLAEGMLLQLSRLELAKEEMAVQARARIVKNFSRQNLGRQAHGLFQALLASKQDQKVDILNHVIDF